MWLGSPAQLSEASASVAAAESAVASLAPRAPRQQAEPTRFVIRAPMLSRVRGKSKFRTV
jgi:hypothetical protein